MIKIGKPFLTPLKPFLKICVNEQAISILLLDTQGEEKSLNQFNGVHRPHADTNFIFNWTVNEAVISCCRSIYWSVS